MILVIRGHIRNSFNTNDLYLLVEEIYTLFPDLKIFIHTWNVFANNISWREIHECNEIVTEETIYNYFKTYSIYIKHIIIDNDKDIQIHGNLEGKIGIGPIPILGWKNYWYGKHRIIEYIYNQHIHDDEQVVNLRFDLLSVNNTYGFDKKSMLTFMKTNSTVQITKNIFIVDQEVPGIDNIYIGNIITMYKLSSTFVNDLDVILSKHSSIVNAEKLVHRINSQLFLPAFI